MNKVRVSTLSGQIIVPDPVPPPIIPPRPGMDYRDYQGEVIENIMRVLWQQGLRNPIFLDAPTGSGKSIIADAYARSTGLFPIVTATHTLQDQYEELLDIPQLTGRDNWPCLIENGVTAADAWCIMGDNPAKECECYDICPYFIQRKEALQQIHTCNYGHLPLASSHILDEAHHYETWITDYLGMPLSPGSLESRNPLIRRKAPLPLVGASDADGYLRALTLALSRGPKRGPKVNRLAEAQRMNRLHYIDNYLKTHEPGRHYTYQKTPKGLRLRPYKVNNVGMARLLMSASLLDPATFFDMPDAVLIQMPSTFPPANRPFIRRLVARIDNKHPESIPKLAAEIDNIIQEHKDSKGVIHCVSYALMDEIYRHSRHKPFLMTHGSDNRDEVIKKFKEAPPGRALLSPSVTTGVDLPYDQCGYQIIAKVPFLPPDAGLPKVVSMRETAKTIIQAYGRGVRSKTDHCVCYILDENWDWFYKSTKNIFPAWFREAVI